MGALEGRRVSARLGGMTRFLAVLLLIPLGGCLRDKPVSQLTYSELKTLAQEVEARCAKQGVMRGSPEFEACTKQESVREATARRENYNRMNSGVVCSSVGTTTVCN